MVSDVEYQELLKRYNEIKKERDIYKEVVLDLQEAFEKHDKIE